MAISGDFLLWIQPTITNISTGIKCSNKLTLDKSGMLCHVVAITIFSFLYNKEIVDHICIDFSAENDWKLLVAAAKAGCNALSAITELGKLSV